MQINLIRNTKIMNYFFKKDKKKKKIIINNPYKKILL